MLTDAQITLSFTSPSKGAVELTRIELSCSGPKIRAFHTVLVRRASPVLRDSYGSFTWTAGLRALALLTVRTALGRMQTDNCIAEISGGRRSDTSAFDRALNKPADWVREIFGQIPSRVLFRRENSELKRAGPVRVALSEALISCCRFLVIVDGRDVSTSVDQLSLLAQSLTEARTSPKVSPVQTADSFTSVVAQLAREQIEFSRTATDRGRTVKVRKASAMRKASAVRTDSAVRSKALSVTLFTVPSAIGANVLLSSALRRLGVRVRWQVFGSTSAALKAIAMPQFRGDPALVVLSRHALSLARRAPIGRLLYAVAELPRSSFEAIVPPGGGSPRQLLIVGGRQSYSHDYVRFLKQTAVFSGLKKLSLRHTKFAGLLLQLKKNAYLGAVVAAPYSQIIASELGLALEELRVRAPVFLDSTNQLYAAQITWGAALSRELKLVRAQLIQSPSAIASEVSSLYGEIMPPSLIRSLMS